MGRSEEAMRRTVTMPKVSLWVAQNVPGEIGVDMSRLLTDEHLASWAAMCPGSGRNAGKRQSGRTNCGNRWWRAALAQAA